MVLHKDFLIIFGGIVNISHEKNDLVLYNLKKDSWKQISFDSDDDIDIFEFNKILGKPIKKSESKSGLVPQKSNIKIPKLVLNNSVSSSFSNKKSSLKEIINKLSIKNKIKKANTFHEHDNQNYNEIKNHSLNNPEKSRNYLMNTSTLLKKILCPVVIVKDKIWEKKKRILLNEFEILDEKIRKEFLIITPTTKIMNSTIAIFKCASKLEGINKRKKILPISQFKMKEITLRIIGNVPCPRDGHTALVIRNKMVIIGGDRHQRQYHDIYECNLNMLID